MIGPVREAAPPPGESPLPFWRWASWVTPRM
jgi:hypothetical protein